MNRIVSVFLHRHELPQLRSYTLVSKYHYNYYLALMLKKLSVPIHQYMNQFESDHFHMFQSVKSHSMALLPSSQLVLKQFHPHLVSNNMFQPVSPYYLLYLHCILQYKNPCLTFQHHNHRCLHL